MASRKQKEPDNPFIYKGYEGPDYFCDRERETENMVGALRNGRNLTVFSPRKIGKTGLIKHVFNRIKETNKDAICIYIDIFATQNLYDFVQALGIAIVEEAVEREKSRSSRSRRVLVVLDGRSRLRNTLSCNACGSPCALSNTGSPTGNRKPSG